MSDLIHFLAEEGDKKTACGAAADKNRWSMARKHVSCTNCQKKVDGQSDD